MIQTLSGIHSEPLLLVLAMSELWTSDFGAGGPVFVAST